MREKKHGVTVVTGASAGVGRATARRFARGGSDVALIARGEAGLEAARKEVESLGRRALVLPVDVADAGAVESAATRVEETLGPIDVWVNNAMLTVFGEFARVSAEEFRRVTEVTYLGCVNGTRAALRRMVPRDRGTIVQVGSALAYRSIPLQSAYCGAKHAIRGFTDSIRTELRHVESQVWLTMVQMPALNTPQFGWGENKLGRPSQPVPPIYEPEVAADAIWYASQHRRREIYVGASTAMVIPGNKLLPALGDWYLARTGYESQERPGAAPREGDGNLWRAHDADKDHGARGVFLRRARTWSVQMWLETHRMTTAAAGMAVLMGVVGTLGAFRWASAR
jgi:short-subunit dehydrogenase